MRVSAWVLPHVQEGGDAGTGGPLWNTETIGRQLSSSAQVCNKVITGGSQAGLEPDLPFTNKDPGRS